MDHDILELMKRFYGKVPGPDFATFMENPNRLDHFSKPYSDAAATLGFTKSKYYDLTKDAEVGKGQSDSFFDPHD